MYYDENDVLADSERYETRQSVLHSPSFRVLDAQLDHDLAKAKRRDALQRRAQSKQKQFRFNY